MKCLRLLLVVLMSVVIPINGFTAIPDSACPMQTQDSDHAMPLEEITPLGALTLDCCVGTDKESPSGKTCKPGQACSVGWLFFALPSSFNLALPVGRIMLTYYAPPLFNGESDTIWHPPRQS